MIESWCEVVHSWDHAQTIIALRDAIEPESSDPDRLTTMCCCEVRRARQRNEKPTRRLPKKLIHPNGTILCFFSRQQNLCKEAQIEELFMVFKTTSMSFEAWVKLFICFSPFFICKFWEIPNTLKGVGTVTLTNDQICSRYIHKWLTVEEREQLEF